ncbi:alkaline phosphatase [Camelimonas sp. ID_303_24]
MKRTFWMAAVAVTGIGWHSAQSAAQPAAAQPAASEAPVAQAGDSYFQAAHKDLQAILARKPVQGRARNVILFIGDGMSVPTVTASRILEGQRRGVDGESNWLTFERRLPHVALSKTWTHDAQVADSAPTATALVSGVKSVNGTLGVTQQIRRGDCDSQKAAAVTTLFELAEQDGRATGIVSTARLTHATPAAAYAKAADRDWENDTEVPAAEKAKGCKDIAAQMIEWPAGDGFEVMLGGGRANFLPKETRDPEDPKRTGARADGRNLVEEWRRRRNDATYVWNQAQFDAADPALTRRLLGLFQPSHMQYETDRAKDRAGEPSLAEMTGKAIDILSKNDKGYVLMVEAGRIDHAHHAGNAWRALTDTIALDAAVKMALDKVNLNDTLVVVTADHSHVFTMAGYPPRGNPVMGLAGKGADGKPYSTLGYMNGPGSSQPAAREELDAGKTSNPDHKQQALVPLASETHGGDDVAIYAGGPWAHLFQGVMEQNVIFHVMAYASGLGQEQAKEQTRNQTPGQTMSPQQSGK